MTKAVKSASPAPGFFPFPDRQAAKMMLWPAEYVLRLQADALCAGGVALKDWLDRRREGADAVLEAWDKLAACHDAQTAAAIHQSWLDGAMKRLALDIDAMTNHMIGIARGAADMAQAPPLAAPAPAEWSVRKGEAPEPAAAVASRTAAAKSTADTIWERR